MEPTHQPIGFEDVPVWVQNVLEGELGKSLGLCYLMECEQGRTDVVIGALVSEEDPTNFRLSSMVREDYQKWLLHHKPLDSAENGSFFEHLNEGSTDGSSFWVVIRVQGEMTSEYLFRMTRTTSGQKDLH
jgi:hypothetical protein